VRGASLTVNDGEIVALIGANGAGKSHHSAGDFRPSRAPERRHFAGRRVH
jgi:ABC-type dipeptide/oligopeptide/nickel transport system ATPase component